MTEAPWKKQLIALVDDVAPWIKKQAARTYRRVYPYRVML
jgi:hypothetical protein